MKSIEKQLKDLYQDIIAKEKIEIHLKNIDRLILSEEEALKQAQEQVKEEEEDIAKLERQGLYNIFTSILGNKEQELEKERQEYLQAYLKKQSVKACLKELKKEKEMLLQNYSSKFNVEANFDKLLENQKKLIRQKHPKIGDLIIHFQQRIANHRAKNKELYQAVREGKKTINALQNIFTSLGLVDVWGKTMKRSVKSKRARTKDKIQREIHKTKKYLQNFEKELFDLSDHYGHDYSQQIHEIHDFVDQFLDSLITDWVVKKKIENSANLVANLVDKITRIVGMLESDIKKTKAYIEVEQKDQRKLVSQLA